MATSIPVPFTGQKIDAGDPQGAIMTLVLLVAGFAAFFFAQDLGSTVKQSVSSTVGMGNEGNAPDIL